jgi:hypothetical protein
MAAGLRTSHRARRVVVEAALEEVGEDEGEDEDEDEGDTN